jgi:flagellar biosynthesis repressor protein FlbT
MTKPFSISLKAGEKIFVNGAVLRVDRKVSLEFLNDVTFLLEAHVMQPEQTRTPLRQLYFIIQSMLIDPMNAVTTKTVFDTSYPNVFDAMPTQELRGMLREVRQSVEARRYYDALKILRNYFPMEDAIMSRAELLGAE